MLEDGGDREGFREVAKLRERISLRFADMATTSIVRRATWRFRHEFFGRPVSEKIRFVRLSIKWTLRRAYHLTIGRLTAPPNRGDVQIAFVIRGGVGDLVNARAFLRSFIRHIDGRTIAIYHHAPKIAALLLADIPAIVEFSHDRRWEVVNNSYDIAGEITDFIRYQHVDRDALAGISGELQAILVRSETRIASDELLIRHHPLLSNQLANLAMAAGRDRIDNQLYYGGIDDCSDGGTAFACDIRRYHDILARFGLQSGRYLTLHDGFDNAIIFSGSVSAKQWPIPHWADLVVRIRRARPDLRLVQLGANRSRQIPGVDRSLISKTSLEECMAILWGSRLHVDGESGLVRIAHALGTRSIVLFGPTPPAYFQLGGNLSIASTSCGGCYYLSQDWMMRCPRSLPRAECMHSIEVDLVFPSVLAALSQSHAQKVT